ncbi:MAG: peptidylprolyl isomerase [archaeon]
MALVDEHINLPTPNKVAVFDTTIGTFEAEIFEDKAPISSKNFLDYVSAGYYNGLIFHRVIAGFMIQGGGFDKDMNEKPTNPAIKNEAGNGLKNEKYTLAMARTNVVDSATSQFFVNVENNEFLDHRDETMQGFGYAVFGKVTTGFEVVDSIAKVQTTTVGHFQDVPAAPVIINKVSIK